MNPLEDFQTVMAEWQSRIILQAIWFVDYPNGRHRLESLLREYAPDLFQQHDPFPTFGPHIAGVPVYEWSSIGATADEWQRWPWVVLWPGLWFEFSDGTYTRRTKL